MDKVVKKWLMTYVLLFAVLNVVGLLAGMTEWGPSAPIALFFADAALIVPVCVPLAIGEGADEGRILASLSLAPGLYAVVVVAFALAASLLGFALGVIVAVYLVLVCVFALVLRAMGAAANHIDQVQGNGFEPRRPGTL